MVGHYTRGLVRWVDGVHYGDMQAMKAEGQARLEPPRNPGYASTGYCMLAVGYVGSRVVVVSIVAGVHNQRGVCSCFAACVLLCTLVAALRP